MENLHVPLPLPSKFVCHLCKPPNSETTTKKTKGICSTYHVLKRHHKEVHHKEVDATFICSCGGTFKELRKGNEHLQECLQARRAAGNTRSTQMPVATVNVCQRHALVAPEATTHLGEGRHTPHLTAATPTHAQDASTARNRRSTRIPMATVNVRQRRTPRAPDAATRPLEGQQASHPGTLARSTDLTVSTARNSRSTRIPVATANIQQQHATRANDATTQTDECHRSSHPAAPVPSTVQDASTQTQRQQRNLGTPLDGQQNTTSQQWYDRFNSITSGPELEAALAEFSATLSGSTSQPQQNGDHIANRNPFVEEAMQLQRLYRSDPKKAMDDIRKNAVTRCPLSKRTLYNHFKRTYAASTPTENEMPSCVPSLPPPLSQNPFVTPFSTNLVASRLAAASNTAPGPDRVRYADWKKLDPTCIVLTSIFNAVRRIRHTPESWKTSTTVLLHKKDQLDDVHNWRPIALSNTMGKLYASCVAWRLAEWCTENHRITNAQKGFMKFEGCLEHNFTVQSVIHMARQQSKEAAVAWLDFRNAFGSIWHTTIKKALFWIGLDEDAVEVIASMYDGCTTRIRSKEGLTDPIPIESGVRQGCPLSPIIFNIAIEPLIRAIKEMEEGYLLGGETINVVAYADDLALIARSQNGLQNQLDVAARVAKWAGLTFNVKKCASLHINRRCCRPTTFRLQGEPLVALGKDDHYRHLGLPTGFKYGAAGENILDNMKTDVESINVSLLAPWQKIDAVRTFVTPQLTFQLKGGMVNRDKLEELDTVIKKCVKSWLYLPSRASNEILYIPHRLGGLNLMPVKELASICDVVEAVHLLYSKDPQVAAVAQSTLQDDVRQKTKQPPTPEIVKDYLDGSTEGIFKGNSVTYSSIWTRLRISTRHLRRLFSMEWSCDSAGINLLIDEQRVRPADVKKQLKNAFHKYLAKKLAAKPDQGKVFNVASLSAASNHFLKNGNFTRFAEWRFIHKARLNVVPLRGSLKFNIGSKSCRKCEYSNETLAHVLNHCGTHMAAATKRHNAVAGRLEKVLPRNDHTSIYINQAVPGSNSDLRPDITVIDEKNRTATIIDIAIPFESSKVAMEEARRRKKEKYAGIEQSLKERGFKTFCDAFVIGSLGSYDPANNACIRRLRIPHRYATLMRRLMICDVIRWSRNIYVEHLSGIRQYTDGQPPTIAPPRRPNHNC